MSQKKQEYRNKKEDMPREARTGRDAIVNRLRKIGLLVSVSVRSGRTKGYDRYKVRI